MTSDPNSCHASPPRSLDPHRISASKLFFRSWSESDTHSGKSRYNPSMPNLRGLDEIVTELRTERTNLSNQLRHVDAALSVLAKLHGKLEANGGSPRSGTRLNAAARMRISLAQKARWAKARSSSRGIHMSEAARRKISRAQKARWAKVKAGRN